MHSTGYNTVEEKTHEARAEAMSRSDRLSVVAGTLLPHDVVEAAREAARDLIASGEWNLTTLGKRIGVRQPSMTRFMKGGGLKPRPALELFKVARRPVPRALDALAGNVGVASPVSAEGERLATLTRLDHEAKHARYVNLEICLLYHPAGTFEEDVVALARTRTWEEGDVPPSDWPKRLERLRVILRAANIDARPREKRP